MIHPLTAFLDLVAADANCPMIAQGDNVMTRGDIAAMSGRITAGLRQHGIGREQGQRILLSLPNSPAMVALVPAIWSLGAVPMFFSSKAPAEQLADLIIRSKPAMTIDEASLSALQTEVSSEIGPVRPAADDDASVVFTSGSTGLPKGVVQAGGTLSSGAARVAAAVGYDCYERIFVPIPFAHDYGWGQMLSALSLGHMLVLPQRDILADIAKAINLHNPTVFAGVPSLFSALLFGISGFEVADTSSLRLLTSTGSPFAARLYDALRERIPQARILRNYGLTETYRSCCLHPEDADAHPGSVGRPLQDVRILIVDQDGQPLAPGHQGEIVHIGAGVFNRYLDDPEATVRTRRLVDGVPAVFTGDIGRLDADGFLTLLGRRDRLVKSMDVRINLNDVEDVFGNLEGVAQVAILAQPSDMTGNDLIAICVPRDHATQRDIQRIVNRVLPPYMRPRKLHLVDALPRTSVGKTDYPRLKATYMGRD